MKFEGEPLNVISLGWGVQSFTMAAMVAKGVLPPVDFAIHADTVYEASGTYAFAEKWTPWLEEHGVKVVTVQNPRRVGRRMNGPKQMISVMLPAYTKLSGSKKKGQLLRQCTGEWKIAPIRRYLQKARNKRKVYMWLGISLDEALRVKPSDVQYVENKWPLLDFVEYLPGGKPFTRDDCAQWLKDNDIEVPPKSACYFCPYRATKDWKALLGTEDWDKAVEFDRWIRDMRAPYEIYVHPARIPLPQVIDPQTRQLIFEANEATWDDECSGICGV